MKCDHTVIQEYFRMLFKSVQVRRLYIDGNNIGFGSGRFVPIDIAKGCEDTWLDSLG